MGQIIQFVAVVIQVMVFAIFARAILSWFPMNPGNQLVRILFQITEPILAPFRRIIPRIGMMDLSPLIAIIVLQVVAQVLLSASA